MSSHTAREEVGDDDGSEELLGSEECIEMAPSREEFADALDGE